MRDVVDEDDNVVGQATKTEIESKGLICRVSFILLQNSDGRLVLQQRSANKRAYPLYWSGAAAGHLEAGESYESAAARELHEELGIEAELTLLGRFYSAEDREMVGVLVGRHDGPYKFEPMEVAQVKLMTPEELLRQAPSMKLTTFVERSLPMLNDSQK